MCRICRRGRYKEQREIARLVAHKFKLKDISAAYGRNYTALSRLVNSPAMKAEICRVRQHEVGTDPIMKLHSHKAAAKLTSQMEKGQTERERLEAAKAILELSG